MQQRKQARERRIEHANNKRSKNAKALRAMKASRKKSAIMDSDDEVSTISSKVSKHKSKSPSKPKVVKKKHVVKSKFPPATETPDEQKVTRYFVTPKTSSSKAYVPSTISTSASTQASTQAST